MKAASRAMLWIALLLAAVNLRPGITSFAPLIERIANDLGLGRGLVSLTTALPVLCMGLLAPFAPRLASRFGLERTILCCMALMTLALLSRLGAQAGVLLIGSAAALGMGIAIVGPLLSGFIKHHFREQAGRVIGWYSLAMTIGGALGVVLTVPVSLAFDDRWVFGLTFWALPALLASLVWLRLPNHREDTGPSTAGLPWGERRAWLVTVFFAIQAGVFYTLATWVVARYHEAGISTLRANALFSEFMLVGLPFAFLMPWLAHRFGRRHLLLMACGGTTTLCLAMITAVPAFIPDLWMVLMGIALSGSFSLSMVLPIHEAESPMAVSRWTAMMLCIGYGMASLMPVLVGLGRDLVGSHQIPFAALTGMALLMTLLAWRLKPAH